MTSLLNLSLILIISLFAVHEMDAMTHAEWRLLPVLSDLPNEQARQVFLWLHIPLFAGMIWALFFASWKRIAAQIVCAALIIHAAAHFLLSGHDLYTFTAPIATITVYGAALISALHLFLSFRGTSE